MTEEEGKVTHLYKIRKQHKLFRSLDKAICIKVVFVVFQFASFVKI